MGATHKPHTIDYSYIPWLSSGAERYPSRRLLSITTCLSAIFAFIFASHHIITLTDPPDHVEQHQLPSTISTSSLVYSQKPHKRPAHEQLYISITQL